MLLHTLLALQRRQQMLQHHILITKMPLLSCNNVEFRGITGSNTHSSM
jgi:hypothetical protein